MLGEVLPGPRHDVVLSVEEIMKFEIKHRFSGAVLFSLECGSLKLCLEAAVKSRANLARANLADANEVPVYISALVPWTICIPASGRVIKVGCQSHSPEEWMGFTAEQLDVMAPNGSAYMDRIPMVVALAEAYWAIGTKRLPTP